MRRAMCFAGWLVLALASSAWAAPAAPDTALARKFGADERGMRGYVMVILKTGPTRVPDGASRDSMFAGHFANIKRLALAGKLVAAGPFRGEKEWRGMLLFAVDTIEEAKALAASDPVLQRGEMVAEYHALYATAAFMAMTELHLRMAPE